MADADKTLKIFLQLQADTAAAIAQFKSGMKEIEAQSAATSAVVNQTIGNSSIGSAGQKITDTTAPMNAAQLAAISEQRAAYAALFAEQQAADKVRFAALREQGAVSSELYAQQNLRVAASEEEAIKQTLINAQMERRVIMETQIEAAEATIAGNPAMAAKLEREAEIRTRALAIQRTLNITTEESIVLAERMVLAQEAINVATATGTVNLTATGRAAAVLAQQLQNGHVSVRTLGTLSGQLLGPLSIAALAAYELYHFISGQVEETNKLHEALKKIADDVDHAAQQWKAETAAARSFEDSVKFADHAKQELDRMAVDMASFRAKELPLWQRFWDDIVTSKGKSLLDPLGLLSPTTFSAGGPAPKPTLGPFSTARDKQLQEDVTKAIQEALKGLKGVNEETTKWGDASADPAKHIQEYTDKLNAAHTATVALQKAAEVNPTKQNFDALVSAMDREKLAKTDLKNLQDMTNTSTKTGHELQKEITAELKNQANILAQIRANQQGVQKNPFLSDDQKNAAMLPLIRQEAAALAEQLKRDQAEQAKLTDPAQWDRMQGAIIQAKAKLTELGFDMQKLSFMGTIRADLTSWVNSFGSTAHQVASIITGTLNTAIQSTSAALTAVIFKTGNWKQAFASAAQSIVQNIIQILLQWVVSQTIMRALSAVFKKADAKTTATAAAESAAAWAPAATAASIATEGAADETGVGALAIAMAAGIALITGASAPGGAAGAKEGMYVDRGTHSTADDVHVRVSKGEGIINARAVAARGGRSWVDSINSGIGRPGYASGGFVGIAPSSPGVSPGVGKTEIHVFNFTDPSRLTKAIMASSAGQKIIIDTIDGHRIDLGI